MDRYSIGLDFGTESGRALLVNVGTGEELGSVERRYRDGVITEYLPGTNCRLDPQWALQNPENYLDVIFSAIPELLSKSGVSRSHIISLGVAFTSCTVLPVDSSGTPLCLIDEFRDHPHSWVKLWKHHAAIEEAEIMERLLRQQDPHWLARYGHHVSVEWLWPKLLEVLQEDPVIFSATDRFVEAADWIVYQLTGQWSRNIGGAGFKAFFQDDLPPVESIFAAQFPQLAHVTETKLRGPVVSIATSVGQIRPGIARSIGLSADTVVAAGMIDAHAAVLGSRGIGSDTMTLVMGTSTCHLVLHDRLTETEGIFGVVKDGLIPGQFAYEAGQPAVGDLLAWVVGLQPANRDGDPYEELENETALMAPGQSGLLCMDWWNGNRSVLGDESLSGAVLGLRLNTSVADVYRGAMESTAFGTRRIIQAFEEAGLGCEHLVAGGGLPYKSTVLMQIYADVTGRKIEVASSRQSTALGAAVAAAVAAGPKLGGYTNISDAVRAMVPAAPHTVIPNPEAHRTYDQLYQHYMRVHDWLGRMEPQIMHDLLSIRQGTIRRKSVR